MSDAASWGSSSTKYQNSSNSFQENNGTGNCHRQKYSTLDKYIKQPETHEQTALGHGIKKEKKEVEKHKKKMKMTIEVIEKRLPK